VKHCELQDKFIAEIIRLLAWCDDTYVSVKERHQPREELLDALKKGPCPLILPINEIQLSGQFYQEPRHTGTVTEIKKRLQQKYGEVSDFSRFLKTRVHPNGEPLMEWRDDNFTELRLTVPTKVAQRASYVSSLRTAEKPWGLTPSTDDFQERPRSKPKKPRPVTTTAPPPSPTPEEDLPPPTKTALINIFSTLWVPGFDPKTDKNLRRAVERHMLLPEDIYLPVERS
jgi:hypothetical protein